MHTLINDAIKNKLIPGMAYATLENDLVSKHCVGLSEYPKIPLRMDMQFDIASLTKLFTTTRILQLMEEEKLTLSDPVQKHLPQFKDPKITLEHCLNHRSGLAPSHSGRYTMSRDEMIQSIMNCDDIIHPVDTITNYSCINFLVLGLIVEALDQPLDTSIKQHITKPLLMDHTAFNPQDPSQCVPTEIMDTRGLIRGEVHDETARAMGGISGNAGLFSTLDDLIKFTQAIMNNTLLSEKTQTLLHTYYKEGRSLGWNTFKAGILYHTGFTGGAITLDLDRNKALILLTNRTFPSRIDTGYLNHRDKIIEAFLK